MTDAGSDWRTLLRHERRQLHVTQDRLARAVHLSPETIRKYENGQRTPTRDSLVRILEILQVPAARGREILSSAGFAVPARMLPAEQHADYFFTADEAHVEIERTPWPQFVVTRAMDIVAVNRAARLLWGVDVERSSRRPPQLHLLALLAEPQFASRVVNFEECLRIVIGLIEGNLFRATTTDDSNLWVDAVFGQRTVDEEQRREAEREEDQRLTRFVEERVGEQRLAVFSMSRLVRAPDFRQAAA